MSHPTRWCSGGPHGERCGKTATVMCTRSDGFEWFACDDPAHHEDAHLTPLAVWFARLQRMLAGEKPN